MRKCKPYVAIAVHMNSLLDEVLAELEMAVGGSVCKWEIVLARLISDGEIHDCKLGLPLAHDRLENWHRAP